MDCPFCLSDWSHIKLQFVKPPTVENRTQSDQAERATFRIVPVNQEELLLHQQKQNRRETELLDDQTQITNFKPITINSLSSRKTNPEYKYNVLVIPEDISQFNQNKERIILKPAMVQEKYSSIVPKEPQIQQNDDGIFGDAYPEGLQRIDRPGSMIEKRENPISYSYDYAVNDGPRGPVISKTEQSDGVLTKVWPLSDH